MKTNAEIKNGSWTPFKIIPIARAVLLLLCLALVNTTVFAAVVTNCTEADLRAAMAGGGTVTFACDGTITLANTITNSTDTVLDASGHMVTISGNNSVRVFYVNTNVNFTLITLTIADGSSGRGAGIFNDGGMLILVSNVFRANTSVATSDPQATPEGGGIYCRGGGINATGCTFTNNKATRLTITATGSEARGGAIRNEDGVVNIQNSIFVGNIAYGGNFVLGPGYVGCDGAGGAVYSSGTVNVFGCRFRQNSASGGPGTAPFLSFGSWGGSGSGGAIFSSGLLAINSSMFSSNSCFGGSGADTTYGNGGYGGSGSGGAICNYGSAVVQSTTFAGNSVAGAVGGYGAYGRSDMGGPYVVGSGGGGGSGNGAAVWNFGSLTVLSSTIASNTATGAGGGAGGGGGSVFGIGREGGAGGGGGSACGGLYNAGSADLINSTIALNNGTAHSGAQGGGGGFGGSRPGGAGGNGGLGGSGIGGIWDANGSVRITNCTVALNSGMGGPGGAGGSGGVGTPSGTAGMPGVSGITAGNIQGPVTLVNTIVAASYASWNLAPLTDNGGPTRTMALLPGSPAIDAGDAAAAPATDQRGFPRPAGSAADIGAFEFGSVMPSLSIARSGPGSLDILVTGNSNQWCRLLVSSNLVDWHPVATNRIGSDGTVLYHDNCASGQACGYYRLVMP